MKNINILAYLYFLNKYNGANNSFYNALFHFHKFVSLETDFNWEKVFWFEDGADNPKDTGFDNVIRTLFHHQYIDLEFHVTQDGLTFLNCEMSANDDFSHVLESFLKNYMGETFKEKSCYIKNQSFPVSCHLCTERLCQDARLNVQDLLSLINFNGFKNPYKKYAQKNPYSS